MKIKLVSLLMCLLVAVSAIPFAVSAATTKVYTSGKYKYTVLQDGTVEIKEYTGNAKNINIPSKLGNKKVTSLGYGSFEDKEFDSVSIPNSVITIGNRVFCDCTMKTVKMADSVKYIGRIAFADCYSLEDLTLSSNLVEIDTDAFLDCYSLRTVTIPSSVNIIGEEAFYNCSNLRNVRINEGVQYIGSGAFGSCDKLSAIFLPKSLNHIGACAFWGTAYYSDQSNWENDALYIDNYLIRCIGKSYSSFFNSKTYVKEENTDYTIKEGTKLIAASAFCDIDNLKSLTFPKSITSIPRSICANCESLTTINVPDNVTYISSFAFKNCTQLVNINLGDNIERIGEYAFYNTAYYNNKSNWEDGILYIDNYLICMKSNFSGNYTVKDGTIGIANSAFSECGAKLSNYEDDCNYGDVYDETDVNYSSADWYGYNGLTGIKLPTSVKYIGSHAFDGCDSITSIELNEGLQVIGVNAFNKCKAIDTIKMPNSVSEICNAAIDKNYVKVIEGYKGSAAQTYANDNKFQFVNVVCENNGEHTPVELKAKKATCFERGYTAHTKCSVCGEDLSFVKYTNKTKLKKSSFTLKSGKKSFKITYKKVKDAKGFQVKYKIGKGKWKTKTFNAKKKVTKTIKKLKKGKKYSVKIRSFAKFSGKKVYSNWTAAKKVTVK